MHPYELPSGAARWSLHLGDALALLRALPDECVDAVVTDPPYSSGGAYRGDRLGSTRHKYVLGRTKLVRPDFAGDNRDQRAYGYWCALWLAECLRIAKPGAPICVFTDWRQLPTTTDAVQAGGWVWRGVGVWDKTVGCRPAKGRFAAQAEFFVWGSKGPMPFERGVACLPGVFACTVKPAEKAHQTGKPSALMRDVVRICRDGGVVLDPFAGSGTTGVAALASGRRFLGAELSPDYYAIARARLEEAALAACA